MDMLRGLKMNASNEIVDNYRPVQPLYGRTVKKSFMVITDQAITLQMSKVVLLPILFAALVML